MAQKRPRHQHSQQDQHLARQGRIAALVIAGAMLIWIGGQYLGAQMGWPVRFVFLLDLAAIAALVWALFVTYWIWKARRADRD